MASDPFSTTPEQATREPEFSLSAKPDGGYAAPLINAKMTLTQWAALLKVDTEGKTDFEVFWAVSLRWNDFSRALQADEAKKAAAAGKA